jgi:hypothetical protein
MADDLRVFVLDTFNSGDFNSSRVFGSLDGARKETAKLFNEALADGDQFAESMGVDDIDDFNEFRDNMLVLFQQEDYVALLECWDCWLADHDFEGSPPFNYDITERPIE